MGSRRRATTRTRAALREASGSQRVGHVVGAGLPDDDRVAEPSLTTTDDAAEREVSDVPPHPRWNSTSKKWTPLRWNGPTNPGCWRSALQTRRRPTALGADDEQVRSHSGSAREGAGPRTTGPTYPAQCLLGLRQVETCHRASCSPPRCQRRTVTCRAPTSAHHGIQDAGLLPETVLSVLDPPRGHLHQVAARRPTRSSSATGRAVEAGQALLSAARRSPGPSRRRDGGRGSARRSGRGRGRSGLRREPLEVPERIERRPAHVPGREVTVPGPPREVDAGERSTRAQVARRSADRASSPPRRSADVASGDVRRAAHGSHRRRLAMVGQRGARPPSPARPSARRLAQRRQHQHRQILPTVRGPAPEGSPGRRASREPVPGVSASVPTSSRVNALVPILTKAAGAPVALEHLDHGLAVRAGAGHGHRPAPGRGRRARTAPGRGVDPPVSDSRTTSRLATAGIRDRSAAGERGPVGSRARHGRCLPAPDAPPRRKVSGLVGSSTRGRRTEGPPGGLGGSRAGAVLGGAPAAPPQLPAAGVRPEQRRPPPRRTPPAAGDRRRGRRPLGCAGRS